jgi:hypothetical protein
MIKKKKKKKLFINKIYLIFLKVKKKKYFKKTNIN